MDEKVKTNMQHWNDMVEPHVKSEFYNVEGFKKGRNTLDKIAIDGVGDVTGKSLLHLQCHFGMDSLSWARLGAEVTGIDFSTKAIKTARALSEELSIPATFVCSDIYDLPNQLSGTFDIVFTSYGVLTWLPDLGRWAEVVASFLKSGGKFFIAEIHPFAMVFADEDVDDLKIQYSYFNQKPMKFSGQGSYADTQATVENTVTYEWMYPVSKVVNSLLKAGLVIKSFNEYPFSCFQQLPFMVKGNDGFWRLPDGRNDIPFMFSLTCHKVILT